MKLVPFDTLTVEKDSKPVQFCHARVKSVPRDMFRAGNVSSAKQSFHASVKLMLMDGSVVNVTTGKDSKASQSSHA